MSVLSLVSSFLTPWNILVLLGTFFTLYVVKFYISYFTRENPIPGPIPLPLAGNLVQLALDGDANDWALKYQEKYGDIFEIHVGNETQIWLCRADLVENILTASKDNNYFNRNPPNSGLDAMGLSTNGIVFNRNREKWFLYRKIFAQAVTTVKFSKQATVWIQQVFASMEGYFQELGFDKKEFNFADWIARLTADMTFLMSMNKYGCTLASLYNTHNPSKPAPYPPEAVSEAESFIHALQQFFSMIKYFLLTPEIIRTKTPFGRKQTKEYMDNLDWLYSALIRIIQQKREEIKNADENTELRPDFLTLLATVNTPRDMTQKIGSSTIDEPLTDEDIRSCLVEMMGGGIDTTANLTCFIVYHVIKHPEVKKRLRKELDTVFGTDFSHPINYDDLSKLVYTEAVIKETSRIMPASSINLRVAANDDVIGGYPIKSGQQIVMCNLGIQHNPKHWTEPKVFDPDRFLEPRCFDIERHSFAIFGGGLRICPGRQLAMTEMKILIALIFRKYDPELATPDTKPKQRFETLNRCYELMLRFKPRKMDE